MFITICTMWVAIGMASFGCSAQKRATKHFNKAYMLSRPVVASGCNELYPVVSNTEYKKGEDIVRIDTFWVDCDSVIRANNEANKGLQQDKGGKTGVSDHSPNKVPITTESHSRVDTSKTVQRDSAGMQVLYDRIDSFSKVVVKKDARIESVTKTRNVLWWVSAALFVVLALVLYAIIKQINLKQVLK
jgi:hypothetical protein